MSYNGSKLSRPKAQVAKGFPAPREVIPDSLAFDVNAITAEYDRVHIDFTSATLYDGGPAG